MNKFSLFVILCCAVFTIAGSSSAQTDSIFSLALAPFKQHIPIVGSIKRTQSYRGVKRESAGAFYHQPGRGTVYQYSSPMNFQVICTDSSIYSMELDKKQGFQFSVSPNEPLKYYDLDPLYRIFSLISSFDSIKFLGSIDSMSIFGKTDESSQKQSITFGINSRTKAMDFIEFFDNSGSMIQQVSLSYSQNRSDQLPETVVTKMIQGDSLLTDSLAIRYKKGDQKVAEKFFCVPEGIKLSRK
jgi:hypothetical protein